MIKKTATVKFITNLQKVLTQFLEVLQTSQLSSKSFIKQIIFHLINEKKISIAFITASNPLDKKSWSGIYYQMHKGLTNNIEKVECIGSIPLFLLKPNVTNRITKFFWKGI